MASNHHSRRLSNNGAQRPWYHPLLTGFFSTGEKIYELCKHGRDQQGRGYSLYRWALWKRDFVEIATNKGLTDDVKHIAS